MNGLEKIFCEVKSTTQTSDCYGTLVDWRGDAVPALREIVGYASERISQEALNNMLLEHDAVEICKNKFPCSEGFQNVVDQIARKLLTKAKPELGKEFPLSPPTWPVLDETNEALKQLVSQKRSIQS